MKILTILANGVEELEAMGTITLLKRATAEIDIFSFSNKVVGKHGVVFDDLKPLHTLGPLCDYDALFIPGGPHYKELESSQKVKDIIMDFYNNDKYIFTICAAPTILGRMGLLKNREYTCFTSMNEDFGGTFTNQYVTISDKIITAKSAAAAIELGLVAINKLFGYEMEEKIKKQIYY